MEALKFLFESFDDRCGREQTAMIRKRGEPNQHSLVPKCRNTIADSFGRFRRHSGANHSANLVQGAAGGFGDTGKVFINVLWNTLAIHTRNTFARFHFLHRQVSRTASLYYS